MVTNGRIIITSTSGLTLTAPTPALSLSPYIGETITRSATDTDAWKFLPATIGGSPGASLPNDKKVASLKEFQLKVHPGYAAYEGTEIMTDKASIFGNELNQSIIKNEQSKLEDLLRVSSHLLLHGHLKPQTYLPVSLFLFILIISQDPKAYKLNY